MTNIQKNELNLKQNNSSFEAKKTVLVVENEEVLRDVIARRIVEGGFEVLESTSGKEAIKRIKKDKPDIIILDMSLHEVDGFSILKKMKKLKINIPAVIISNSGQPADIDKAIKLGACDYLVKTEFEPDEVIEKIHRCLIIKQDEGSNRRENKTILIIEDDKFLRDLCIKKFDQLGYKIDYAGEGIEGFEKIIKNKPDLVILDLIIPGIEGWEVLKKVRSHKDKSVASIPIVILSNLGEDSDTEKAMELGANDYLIKAHFTIDDVASRIKKYIK